MWVRAELLFLKMCSRKYDIFNLLLSFFKNNSWSKLSYGEGDELIGILFWKILFSVSATLVSKTIRRYMDTGDHEETGTRIFSCIPASLKGIHLAAALTSWHCLITVYLSFTQYQSLSVCVYVFAYPHKHSLKHIHKGNMSIFERYVIFFFPFLAIPHRISHITSIYSGK